MKLSALVSATSAYTTDYYSTTPSYTTIDARTGTTTGSPFRDCGGTITEYETIASPIISFKYDQGYPNNVQCAWHIELGDHVAGFNIVNNFFLVEYEETCGYDWVSVVANGHEENFCSDEDVARKRREAKNEAKESSKYTPDLVNPINTGFPSSKLIIGGSAVISMFSDNTVTYRGFEFELVKLTRFEIIEVHVRRLINSVADQRWGSRYAGRMLDDLTRLKDAENEDGSSCYDKNFPESGEEGDEITVFDADNMCKLNGQVNSAINTYARHNACTGRGKVYRQIIRSARKVKKFFNDKNDC